MSIPFLGTTGPAEDLETFNYIRDAIPHLPDPPGFIPFHRQGQPIPDQFKPQTGEPEVVHATNAQSTNPLPFTRWHGTTVRQINQPQFLSVNEDIYLQ